jgi:hypothetical protein
VYGAAAPQVEDADDLQSMGLLGWRNMVLPKRSHVNSDGSRLARVINTTRGPKG